MKKIPVIGNVIGNSPIGSDVDTVLVLTKTVGNALQGQGSILDAGKQVISDLGGNTEEVSQSAKRNAQDLLTKIIS